MNFEDLIIETNSAEYDFHSMKNAMESFVTSVHQDDDSIVDATEQVLISVDEYLCDIATEAINPMRGLKNIGSTLAKPFKALYNVCVGWVNKIKSKKAATPEGEKKKNGFIRMWEGLAGFFKGLFSKFSKKKNLTPEEQEEASDELNKGKEKVEKAVKETQNNLYGGKGNGGRHATHKAKKAVANNLNSDKARDPSEFDVSNNSATYTDFDSDDLAMEGIFSKPKTSDAIVAKMQKNVKKLKTVEACDSYLEQLNNEASKFNEAIKSLQAAASDYQSSQDKKALKASVKPVLANLKKTCKLLKISSISGDPKNISSGEIQKLHDVITGAKAAVQARKQELQSSSSASESFMDDELVEDNLIEDFDEYLDNVDAATEGIISADFKRTHRIKTGEAAKKLAGIVKQARKATKQKNYDEAITLYKQAKNGYAALLKYAKKIPDKTTETDSYKSTSKVAAINWCTEKMGECDNAIEKIKNGQMKAERKAGIKAEKKGASESLTELEEAMESLDNFDEDESVNDSILDLFQDENDVEDNVLESLLQA